MVCNNLKTLKPLPASYASPANGRIGSGGHLSRFWRRYNVKFFYWTPSLTYVFVVPFLSCLKVSSGLVMAWTFGVHLKPTLAPVLA